MEVRPCFVCLRRGPCDHRESELIPQKARPPQPAENLSFSSQVRRLTIQMVASRVQGALRSGKLVRPSLCEVCGAADRLDAHHEDYSKPLTVVWVCRKCHRAIDRKRCA